MWYLSWEFESLSPSFSCTTFSSDIKSNQPTSLYSLISKKSSKVFYIYIQSPSSLLLISGGLGIYNIDILRICIAKSYHVLSVFSLLLEMESLASLSQVSIERRFQKVWVNSENSFLISIPLEPFSIPKSVLVRVLQRNRTNRILIN